MYKYSYVGMHRQVVDTVRVDQRTAVVDKDRRIRPRVVVRVLAQALVVHFDVSETTRTDKRTEME